MKKFDFTMIEELKESVLDIPKEGLSKQIWENNKLVLEVKNFILHTLATWKKLQKIDFHINSIYLIGSMASEQYAEDSDIDITVKISNIMEEQLKMLTKVLPNGNTVPGTNHPLNFYLILDENKFNTNITNADNVYDVVKDGWIKKSKLKKQTIPFSYIMTISRVFLSSIDLAIEEYKTDKLELDYYKDLVKTIKDSGKKEVEKRISMKKEEILADLDSLELLHYLIKVFRQEAFDHKYNVKFSINIESTSPNYSVNNAMYKMIEKMGYLAELEKYSTLREKIQEEIKGDKNAKI